MRRTLMPAALTVTALMMVAGCSLLTPITLGGGDAPSGPLAVGSCLDAMNGADSDRTSLVDCSRPHLFEVTAIDEWPEMADLIAESDAGTVWDALHRVDGKGDSAAYGEWASSTCQMAAQTVLGIADLEVQEHTATELKLSAGGDYGIDLSLGSRAEFVAGDHRTVCSVAWYDESGPRTVESVAGIGFDDYLGPGFALTQRECWDAETYVVSCARPHAAQLAVAFEGLVAFGPKIVKKSYDGEMTDNDYELTDAFCGEILSEVLPAGSDVKNVGYVAETMRGYGWDEFDGTVSDDGGYFFACLVVPFDTDDRLTGDIFEGTLAIDT